MKVMMDEKEIELEIKMTMAMDMGEMKKLNSKQKYYKDKEKMKKG